ncbi:MAG: hypothetical protein Q8Q76_08895 [Methylotenera sp.]|nr:hypothetical protein [Methylotenera sp.]
MSILDIKMAGWKESVTGLEDAALLVKAEDELKELRKDRARLDWLASTEQIIGNVMLPTECVEKNLDGGLRGMIDCAMSISSNVK